MTGMTNSIPRAVRLPRDTKLAADFVLWGLDSGLYTKMSAKDFKFSAESIKSGEVGPEGASDFWKITKKYFD